MITPTPEIWLFFLAERGLLVPPAADGQEAKV